jgi:hypothetical protein
MPERDVYAAINEAATNDQIKDLLRRHKEGYREVRVSGNKDELIQHLKDAVSGGFIPSVEIARLVQESEENGDQHVFYYLPKDGAVRLRCGDGSTVAKRLWGAGWEKLMSFPVFTRPDSACEWADFRVGLAKKPHDWLGKLYGHERHLRLIGEKPTDTGGFIRHFEPEDEATVYVVRWSGPDLLEVRLPRCDSKGTLLFRMNEVWSRLQPALDRDEFVPWNLKPARHRMLKERKERGALYQLGSLQFHGFRLWKGEYPAAYR